MIFSNKRFLPLTILSLISLSFVLNPVTDAQIAKPKVGFVFAIGGLGDQSFNDAALTGLLVANNTYDLGITEADYAEPADIPEITDLLQQFANTGAYDLLFSLGYGAVNAVNATAFDYPSQKFVIIDQVIGLPNVASVVFKEEEGSFLAGVMAAMTTTTNIVAFLGGEESTLIRKFEAGFQQGVHTINENIEILTKYAPDQGNPWNDIAGGRSVTLNFINKGADIIFAAAGRTGQGMIDAVNETNILNGITGTESKASEPGKIYGIGVDTDQDWITPGHILTSMIKRIDTAVFNQISDFITGTWEGTRTDLSGLTVLDLANDGVGLSPMVYTNFEKDADYNGSTRWEIVQAYRDAIMTGSIIVRTEPMQPEPESTTITTTNPATTTSTDMSSTDMSSTEPSSTRRQVTTTPGFAIYSGLTILILGIIVRKKRIN